MKKIFLLAAVGLCLLTGCSNARTDGNEAETGKTETMKEDTEEARAAIGTEADRILAVYPEMAPYPNEEEFIDKKTGEFDSDGFSKVFDVWWEQKRGRREMPKELADSLNPFFTSAIRQFLTEEIPGTKGDNRICSPVNIYMALGMLAETVDGDSRQQILTLLDSDSLEDLRRQAGSVWDKNYSQDGAVTSILANSLWLDSDLSFNTETLENLAKYYYASSYWGQMGSKELDENLQSWINEQTGGLLKEQASGLHMTDDTLAALASTIYFRAKWSDEFSKANTREEIFHGPDKDLTCEFMHQGGTDTYYWGEKFGAVNKNLQESGGMWLILPDEGVTPEEVLLEEEMMELVLQGGEGKNSKTLIVNLAMPKFDVVSNISLKEGLESLGVTDVFDGDKSDFTPLVGDMEGVFLSSASHAARVMVDEEGCIAAAYTVMAAAGAAMPPEEEMDFVLDRPFIFVITGECGLPLFAGIVNRP